MNDSTNIPTPPTRRWPFIIAGMLILHATIMVVAIIIATRDRSFTVLPNSYQQALAWDKTQALKRQSEKLGWKVEIQTATSADPLGRRQAAFILTDAANKPIDNATLRVSYYHRTYANDIQRFQLEPPTGPGRFEQLLPLRRPGFWEFQIHATANGQEFVTSATHFVPEGQ